MLIKWAIYCWFLALQILLIFLYYPKRCHIQSGGTHLKFKFNSELHDPIGLNMSADGIVEMLRARHQAAFIIPWLAFFLAGGLIKAFRVDPNQCGKIFPEMCVAKNIEKALSFFSVQVWDKLTESLSRR